MPHELQIKALEFSKDWSIWLVTVQTGIIGVTMLALGKPQESALRFISPARLRLALWSFFLSIATASLVLVGIATMAQRIDDKVPEVFSQPLFTGFPLPGVGLWRMTGLEHIFFLVGFILFISSLRLAPRQEQSLTSR